jgi:hypothetical protein
MILKLPKTDTKPKTNTKHKTDTKPKTNKNTSVLEKPKKSKKVHNGGENSATSDDCDNFSEIIVPVIKMYSFFLMKNSGTLDNKIFETKIERYKNMLSTYIKGKYCENTPCKVNRSNFIEFKCMLSTIEVMKNIDEGILDTENFLINFRLFLEAILFPFAKVTINIYKFIDDFVNMINSKTRDNYIINKCVKKYEQNSMNNLIDPQYTCGRAISVIPYANNYDNTNKPRIMIHQTKQSDDDVQNASIVTDYANNLNKNSNGAK